MEFDDLLSAQANERAHQGVHQKRSSSPSYSAWLMADNRQGFGPTGRVKVQNSSNLTGSGPASLDNVARTLLHCVIEKIREIANSHLVLSLLLPGLRQLHGPHRDILQAVDPPFLLVPLHIF